MQLVTHLLNISDAYLDASFVLELRLICEIGVIIVQARKTVDYNLAISIAYPTWKMILGHKQEGRL